MPTQASNGGDVKLPEGDLPRIHSWKPTRKTHNRACPAHRLPGRMALAGEDGPEEVLRFRVLATGEERRAIVKAMPIFGKQGTVRMAVNISRDITESKRAAEAPRHVREAEHRRIARDLHDRVLQDLSYTAAAMGMIMLRAEEARLKEQMQAAVDSVRHGIMQHARKGRSHRRRTGD